MANKKHLKPPSAAPAEFAEGSRRHPVATGRWTAATERDGEAGARSSHGVGDGGRGSREDGGRSGRQGAAARADRARAASGRGGGGGRPVAAAASCQEGDRAEGG
eukprot:7383164-Prymnesium_polylepis.2